MSPLYGGDMLMCSRRPQQPAAHTPSCMRRCDMHADLMQSCAHPPATFAPQATPLEPPARSFLGGRSTLTASGGCIPTCDAPCARSLGWPGSHMQGSAWRSLSLPLWAGGHRAIPHHPLPQAFP